MTNFSKTAQFAPRGYDLPRDKTLFRQDVRAIALYLAIAYATAWVFWLIGFLITKNIVTLPFFPIMVVGSFGPFLGALVTILVTAGRREALRFFIRGFDPRMGLPVFLISLLLLPLLAVLVEFIHAWWVNGPPHFRINWAELPVQYLFLFVVGGTLAEEYGWSLLSDQLDRIFKLTAATFVLGAIWAVWHLPLFFIITPHAIQGYTPFYIFFIVTVAMRFLFAWTYHRGQRNVFSNMIFHTSSNLAYSIVSLAPSPGDMSTDRLWIFGVLNIVSAIILWKLAPPRLAASSRSVDGSLVT